MPQFSRRSFLQVGAGAAIGLGGRQFTLARQPTAPTPGEPVRYAFIGVGIQGANLLRSAVTLPGGHCVAAADLYDGRHAWRRKVPQAARGGSGVWTPCGGRLPHGPPVVLSGQGDPAL